MKKENLDILCGKRLKQYTVTEDLHKTKFMACDAGQVECLENDKAELLKVAIEATKEVVMSDFEVLQSSTARDEKYDERDLYIAAENMNKQYIDPIVEITGVSWDEIREIEL